MKIKALFQINEEKDDIAKANVKQTSEIHTNGIVSFISDKYKGPDLEVQTIQKKKQNQKKEKEVKNWYCQENK